MTTGAHGVHVVVPLAQQQSFSVVKKFARSLAHQLCTKHPQHLTLDMRKQQRGNKLFIDTLRNQWAQLAVAPYSVRAREGAPVATPLAWHELSDPAMHSQRYTIENIFRRLGHANNPWHHFYDSMRMLPD